MHREELFSDIDRWLDEHYPQLEQALMESLSIASVRAEEAPGAPFGVEVARALQHALQLAQSWGFAVCDVDGYCGIADMFGAETADMSECIGVLGHLDVVPARAEDWTYPPFAPRCIDGRIYGRGTTDDKGPLFAALFAALALHECGLDFGKGLRFIMGCNEESGMACVRYYLQHHQQPSCGFTPDAHFPLVVGEKGILQYRLHAVWEALSEGCRLLSVRCEGAANVVPAQAVAMLSLDGQLLPQAPGITVEKQDDDLYKIIAQGTAAHASTPEEGDNALVKLLGYLGSLELAAGGARDFVRTLYRKCAQGNGGEGWGLAACDALSQLTLSPDGLLLDECSATLVCDMRFPVSSTGADQEAAIEAAAQAEHWSYERLELSEPLYLGDNNPLATTLLQAYREVTQDMSDPMVIGGGTYAKTMKNFLGFGPQAAQGPSLAHQADEYISCEELLRCAKVYARAIYRLLNTTEEEALC